MTPIKLRSILIFSSCVIHRPFVFTDGLSFECIIHDFYVCFARMNINQQKLSTLMVAANYLIVVAILMVSIALIALIVLIVLIV